MKMPAELGCLLDGARTWLRVRLAIKTPHSSLSAPKGKWPLYLPENRHRCPEQCGLGWWLRPENKPHKSQQLQLPCRLREPPGFSPGLGRQHWRALKKRVGPDCSAWTQTPPFCLGHSRGAGCLLAERHHSGPTGIKLTQVRACKIHPPRHSSRRPLGHIMTQRAFQGLGLGSLSQTVKDIKVMMSKKTPLPPSLFPSPPVVN